MHDTCDRCGPNVAALVTITKSRAIVAGDVLTVSEPYQLTLCGHHYRSDEALLALGGWEPAAPQDALWWHTPAPEASALVSAGS